MITLIEVTQFSEKNNKKVWLNLEAIDSIYRDTDRTYGILMRSGVVYTIYKDEFETLMKLLEKMK